MKLRYVIIKVKDIQRAKKFYTKLLNKEPVKEEVDRMIEFDLENLKIGLYNPLADGHSLDNSDFGTNCMPAFGVDNLESELKRISNFAKIICHEKVGYHEWFEFQDTEGNILEIHKI